MNNNMSPWLYQLIHKRNIETLNRDLETNIAIIGAGISGIMTAYFILKNTNLKVTMVEAFKLAHGATGHNAGQLVADFERELHDIAHEFGVDMAVQAEKSVHSAWALLEQIFSEATLTTPYSTFMGYNGYESLTRLTDELKNNILRAEAGEPIHKIFISENAPGLDRIPHIYKEVYSVIPHEDILNLLETDNKNYIAAMSLKKGCLNSALLCEEVVGYMLANYAGRFTLLEHTPIREVVLESDHAILCGEKHHIVADKVVLCTNGFAKFKITNNHGGDVDTLFHHQLRGFIGYMAAYVAPLNQQPNALAYYSERSRKARHANDEYYDDPYFYLTRRPYELEKNEKHNLICVGGPEVYLADSSSYDPRGKYDKQMAAQIETFLKKTHKHTPKDTLEFRFTWHGLMGFTQNGIRMIGFEPLNPVLLYNLGCNGVGILPSIYGASRISQLLRGDNLPVSIFDPKRCGNKAC